MALRGEKYFNYKTRPIQQDDDNDESSDVDIDSDEQIALQNPDYGNDSVTDFEKEKLLKFGQRGINNEERI